VHFRNLFALLPAQHLVIIDEKGHSGIEHGESIGIAGFGLLGCWVGRHGIFIADDSYLDAALFGLIDRHAAYCSLARGERWCFSPGKGNGRLAIGVVSETDFRFCSDTRIGILGRERMRRSWSWLFPLLLRGEQRERSNTHMNVCLMYSRVHSGVSLGVSGVWLVEKNIILRQSGDLQLFRASFRNSWLDAVFIDVDAYFVLRTDSSSYGGVGRVSAGNASDRGACFWKGVFVIEGVRVVNEAGPLPGYQITRTVMMTRFSGYLDKLGYKTVNTNSKRFPQDSVRNESGYASSDFQDFTISICNRLITLWAL